MNKHHKHTPTRQRRRWLRKAQVAERYSVSTRTADRWAKSGRLPPWQYLPGSMLPMQLEEVLDAHDRKATVERSPLPTA
jgi:predicted site-specific integrase-resolvase